jgi:nitrite reductase/ring-hydroxylating ferredoxin subunit
MRPCAGNHAYIAKDGICERQPMFISGGVTRADLERLGRKVIRKSGKQVLLIASGGRIFAIANRCPHEGYPLSEGNEGPGCVLTCNWHNWKFDLATGEALVGRDPVRTYAVEVRDGEIFVDLSDPPAQALRERVLKGLDAAIADNDVTRMAREVVRLMHVPSELKRPSSRARTALVHAIKTTADKFEDGMTHAHGAAADWLTMSDIAKTPEQQLTAILEPIAHLAWDTQGAGKFPYENTAAKWEPRAFLSAIETEDEAGAMSRIRGALAEGLSYAQLRPVFGEAALSHYADFGHSAIYTFKIGQLIERLGGEASAPLLLSLTRSFVRATREERLPEFRFYAKALSAWDGKGDAPARAEDFVQLSVDAILKRVLASSARPPREIYDALLGAAAWNMLHFDLAFERAADNSLADNIGWLDFTHSLTFANAVRHICGTRPDLWPRALLQMALFVGRNRKYVTGEDDGRWRVNDRDEFLRREMSALYDHGIVEPIIACHRLKVLFALEDELHAAPDAPWADAMCAAVNRYLSNPMKRHHGLRIASQALDFIAKEA